MRKIILFVCSVILCSAFTLPLKYNPKTEINTTSDFEIYTGKIEHLFTHCLLAYPSLAFANDNSMMKYYNEDCITPYEFKKILQNLYKNNYALIDINSVFEEVDGKVIKKDVLMPVGKKPLIFSFDDVNYDHKKTKTGMVDKIIIDSNGNLASQTETTWSENPKIEISYDNEFIPILENFVNSHPDFSVNGAKGTICLTGYDGILGYRTNSSNKTNREQEIKSAKAVANKLKKNGWNFACHSYGHYHMKNISNEKFKEDIRKWKNEVEPIVGKTSVYVYPYGEWEIYKNHKLTEKHKILTAAGFNFFCGVGNNFFSYLPYTDSVNKTLLMDRKAVDGNSLLHRKAAFAHLFDAKEVYDYKFRPSNL